SPRRRASCPSRARTPARSPPGARRSRRAMRRARGAARRTTSRPRRAARRGRGRRALAPRHGPRPAPRRAARGWRGRGTGWWRSACRLLYPGTMRPLLLAACLAALATPAAAARTLAVSYFDNNTGKPEYDPLAKGLADMLITDLSAISSLQIVEREKL